MYTKAQQIGLPALFVDLRHEATHGDMPSLTSLRNATQRAMQWLWDDYWEKLEGGDGQRLMQVNSNLAAQILSTKGSSNPNELTENAAAEIEGPGDTTSEADPPSRSWEKWQGYWTTRSIGTIGAREEYST